MIFSEIASSLSIFDRVTKYWKSWMRKKEVAPETIGTRLVRLLESHGVHRNQIPRFVGHGLTITDVQTDELLISKLTEEILDDVCERLAVRGEWLDGADSHIYPYHNFYKYPERFSQFLDNLRENNPGGYITGVLIAPKPGDEHADALIILEETIDYIGDKPVCRYHLCNNWPFTYWKGRAYLTACIAVAWKRKNYIHGIVRPKQFIDSIAYGEALLGWSGKGIWALGHKSLDPEHMALRVEDFLNEIDLEVNNYGIKSGLQLWLELYREGLMDAGFGDVANEEFKTALENVDSRCCELMEDG